jgi:hypothetical protein
MPAPPDLTKAGELNEQAVSFVSNFAAEECRLVGSVGRMRPG